MATKKAGSKGGGAKKAAAKATSKNALLKRIQPLYGRPILDAIKRGNVAEMKRIAAQARTHVKEVNAALSKLDASLKK